MCGIAGFLYRPFEYEVGARTLRDMTDALVHRGPDGDGVWCDPNTGIGLGHRRLAIVDLSDAGAQPMMSADGRFVLSYNGEIYNAAEVRESLIARGVNFRGHCDTEVLLEGFSALGITQTLHRCIGMFALAVWDRRDKVLTLVRDRLGIKPLYWARFGNTLLFGSELSAIRRHPDFVAEIDRSAVVSYLRHNYVPGPLSIFSNVHKLQPGEMLSCKTGEEPQISAYWTLSDARKRAVANQFSGSEDEAVEALHTLLDDAVGIRMIADVPLGAFLSGGIDSSTVVALMQARSSKPIRTFSIGFHEAAYNEASHAKSVAEHLGTEHTELYVSADEARAVIPRLPEIYNEPFADSSQIPMFLVSHMTSEHVTVALSGDGGDELFGGYNRYFQVPGILAKAALVPGPLRGLTARALKSLPPSLWSAILSRLPPFKSMRLPGDKVHKLANILPLDHDRAYRRLVSEWDMPGELVIGGKECAHVIWENSKHEVSDFVDRMQYVDTLTYLPDDILTKVDRASMAVSLEARVPLLDHRVVEFAWSLPQHYKVNGQVGKQVLRGLLDRSVPRELIDRPKMGFGVPIDSWLRGPLREWAEDLLSETYLKRVGLFNPEPIRQRWKEHLSGQRNWQYSIWGVLMFNAWLEHGQGDRPEKRPDGLGAGC